MINIVNHISNEELLKTAPYSYLVVSILSLLVYRVPYLSIFFRTFQTLIHETGHSIMAFLTSGKTLKIELNPDLSGVAITQSSNKIKQFLISLSGYVFSSLFVYIACLLIYNQQYKFFIYTILGITLFQLFINVRNRFGVIWSIAVAMFLIAYILYLSRFTLILSLILCSILLYESIIMAFLIFIIAIKNPKNAGDAKNLESLTHISARFWGLLFVVQSLYFSYLSVKLFI